MNAIEKVKKLITDFLDEQYDPYDFSFELPDTIVANYEEIEKINKDIAVKLDDIFPEICAEYEPGGAVEPFQKKIKEAYNKVFSIQ